MISTYKQGKAKTKILATIGPACDKQEVMEQMILNGTDAFRLNFSHGNFEYFEKVFANIDAACNNLKKLVAILVDLQGPKIRVGEVNGKFELKQDEKIEITIDEVVGNAQLISTSYKQLISDVNIGETILINDGLINLQVVEKREKSVVCKVIAGGELSSKKGINLPGTKLSTSSITEQDFKNLEFAMNFRVDFVALSFVREAKDIHQLRSWLMERNYPTKIIAKIEKPEAVNNFDDILCASEGIMIARGDLGVEMQTEIVPIIQKQIIEKCNQTGKLVITATQMLETMINNSIPTRAEASDVSNAVVDGTDVVMLSGETSVGKNPVLVVKTMHNILKATESVNRTRKQVEYFIPNNIEDKVFENTAKAVVEIANRLSAKAIIVFTFEGRHAISLSKYRPNAPIFAFSNSFLTLNILNLRLGVEPYFLDVFSEEDSAIREATKFLLKENLIEKGDLLMFTSAAPLSDNDRRTWIRYLIV